MSRLSLSLGCVSLLLASSALAQAPPTPRTAPVTPVRPRVASPDVPATPARPVVPAPRAVPAAPATAGTAQLQVAELIARLADPNNEVQIDAVRKLGRLGPSAADAVAPLAALLTSNNPTLRLEAARSLGLIGPASAKATDSLTLRLADDVPQIRSYAAYALGQIGQPAAVAADALVKVATSDPEPSVRRMASVALQNISPPHETLTPWIVKTLQEAEPNEVLAALRTLATWGPDAIPILRDALAHERAAYWAALVAAELGPKAADLTPALVALLKHNDPEVRLQALMALGAIGPAARAAAPEIAAVLQTEKIEGVLYASAFALGQIGVTPEAYEILVQAFRSESEYLQVIAGWALLQQANLEPQIAQQAKAEILAATKSSDLRLREIGVRMVAELKAEAGMKDEALEALSAALNESNPAVTAQVMNAYAARGEASVSYLVRQLAQPNTRLAAIQTLRRMGAGAVDAVPALVAIVRDPAVDDQIRVEAQYALGAMGAGATDAVPALTESLGSPVQQVRYSAIYALGKIGPTAKPALPELEKFVNSENSFDQVAAIWTMMRIQTGDPALAQKAAPLLARALNDERPHIRARAAAELGTLGVDARGYLTALREAAAGQSPQVRGVIEEAIRKIEGTK